MKSLFLFASITLGTSFSFSCYAQPKLILQITVDQLRGDMPLRQAKRNPDGGFAWIYKNGVDYRNAHHTHANTETIVGHTTLATGALPADHGMVGNIWFDKQLNRMVYNVEDADYPLLDLDADVNQKTEIDPTQKAAKTSGRSPNNILASTFSDELLIHSNGKAKIFGVSVKDRGAISMAGHGGKAFWFSKKTGDFVTSQYYFNTYPDWVKQWNQQKHYQTYSDSAWQLSEDISKYRFGNNDDQPWEMSFGEYGRVFPHAFGSISDKYFTTLLTVSPVGDELTVSFAKALLNNEALGTRNVTDYLSVSLSATDYVGHFFGPSSLEYEDNLVRLDKTLKDLLDHVDKAVGLKNTLVVLSADHGSAEVPGYLNQFGIDAQYVDVDAWPKSKAFNQLKQKFGVSKSLIKGYFHPYIYLDHVEIEKNNLDIDSVSHEIAKIVRQFDGVHSVYTAIDIVSGNIDESLAATHVKNNFNHGRSGEVAIVLKPHYFINDFDGLAVASTHGSPWQYDTYVPIVFAGYKIKSKTIHRQVSTLDVATTLSAIIGAKPPSSASGKTLFELNILAR